MQDPPAALGWLRAHRPQVRSVMLARRNQTNEVARCATLLPALALLPEPVALIDVGASAGPGLLDLDPVDPGDPDMQRWLPALVWPEHHERSRNLRDALRAAAAAPARVRRGDLLNDLPGLVAQAPTGSTVVVIHTATLAYLDPARRQAFVELLRELGVRRLGAEGPRVLPHLAEQLPSQDRIAGWFIVSLDDRALALADPHGRTLTWL